MSSTASNYVLRFRALVAGALRVAGFKVIRHPGPPEGEQALVRLVEAGVEARTVFDVGAAFGDWAAACARRFPHAEFVLLEPVEEYRPVLQAQVARLGRGTLVHGAASDVSGTANINVHHDFLAGSSLLHETEGGHVDGAPRTVPTWRLDDLVKSRSLRGPFFLKIDVQGAEIQVLDGAQDVLQQTIGVMLEVSFLPFFSRGAEFAALVAYMEDRGFVIYDVSELRHRPLDGALAQADVLFVTEDSPVRQRRGFSSPEQRDAMNRRFQSMFAERLEAESRKS